VLEGSVRREGNKVRVTLQLINANDDSHVWAQDYDRTLTSALSLESEVAKAVAYQLAVQLTPSAKAANAPTQDPLAYDFYLKARLIRPSSGMAPDPDWLKGADLLTLAINRDPSFTLAYVERFGIYLFLYLQHDTTGRFRTLAKSDLDAAQRLAPGSPAVLGMEAEWAFAEQDLKRSLDFFSQAKAAGLADPNILTWESALHSLAGNYDESLSTLARLAAIDPGNAYVLLITGLSEAVGGRTAQALKIFDVLAARAPGDTLLRIQRPFLEFMMTGAEAPFAVVDKGTRLLNFPEPDHPAALWYAGHYKETRDQIDRLSYKDMSTGIYSYSPVFGVPKSPVVWVRGQIDLQLGDRKEADKDAKAVLSWVASQSETKWNRWFLRYLTAFAHLLQGDKASAIRFAHEALKLSPDGGTGVWPVAPYLAATVLAMAGEQDEAAKLLEKVAFGSPCILPVEIVRNPELTVSLADNPRYQMLKAKLEAQMVENRKLFASPQ